MDRDQFWNLINEARRAAAVLDVEEVAESVVALLERLPQGEIVQAAQVFWDLMAESYRGDLWGAAYLINGGASDDGFEYFRCWLISQGRAAFERAVADPDTLAELPAVLEAAKDQLDLEGEPLLNPAWDAYRRKTGEELPADSFTISYPSITFEWDFEDGEQMAFRLRRLSRLYDGESLQ